MKRVLSLMLAAVLALSFMSLFIGCGPARDEILKIYNWGDYIDEEIFEEFSEWYKDETGKKVTVVVDDFDENESGYTKIAMGEQDCDLFCPSDYMVERMINDDMLLPLDKSIIDPADYLLEEVLETANNYDPGNVYSLPYMWGTMGIMYNTNYIDYGTVDSWDAIFTNAYSSKNDAHIYMKDSERDSFTISAIYAAKATLSTLSSNFSNYTQAYQQELQRLINDVSTPSVTAAKNVLLAQHELVYNYEIDNGKMEMADASNASAGRLGLFWSCDAGYVMNEYENDAGTVFPGNKAIWYAVPKEGSNIYVDSFVIPKVAKNVSAANYFLRFLCEENIARANMEYVGAASPVEAAYNKYKKELQDSGINEEGGFFNITKSDGTPYDDAYKTAYKQMYIDMLFPPQDVLDRCAVMRDIGFEGEEKLADMWLLVRGN